MRYCIKVTTDGQVELLPWVKDAKLSRMIGCFCIEVVHAVLLPTPFVMICDDSGLIAGKPINDVASFFYGTQFHGQGVAGDIVFLKEALVDGEPDVVGMNETEVDYLLRMIVSRCGISLPEDLANVQA